MKWGFKMEQNKTLSGLICQLAKEGYTITVEEYETWNGGKCRVKLAKGSKYWTRIVPYELLDKDGFLMYILELLKKCME